jgi:hypothetical protein
VFEHPVICLGGRIQNSADAWKNVVGGKLIGGTTKNVEPNAMINVYITSNERGKDRNMKVACVAGPCVGNPRLCSSFLSSIT